MLVQPLGVRILFTESLAPEAPSPCNSSSPDQTWSGLTLRCQVPRACSLSAQPPQRSCCATNSDSTLVEQQPRADLAEHDPAVPGVQSLVSIAAIRLPGGRDCLPAAFTRGFALGLPEPPL